MIYIIGLNHGYQSLTDVWPPIIVGTPLENRSKTRQIPFQKWLKTQLQGNNKLLWIFEEWTYGNQQTPSIAFSLIEELDLDIQYLQIDPKTRPYRAKEENGEYREQIWIEKILSSFNTANAGDALLIVGDDHVESLRLKLESLGYQTKCTREVSLLEYLDLP